jgi:hypothetical protein
MIPADPGADRRKTGAILVFRLSRRLTGGVIVTIHGRVDGYSSSL